MCSFSSLYLVACITLPLLFLKWCCSNSEDHRRRERTGEGQMNFSGFLAICLRLMEQKQPWWALEGRGQWTSHFSSVQSLICVELFMTPWTAACQPSLSVTNSQSLLKLMSIESVMPSNNDLILCCPLLLQLSVFPGIMVISNDCSLHQVAKVLEFHLQHHSFQWIFRTDFF